MGAASMSLHLDHDALRAVTDSLAESATTFDETGRGAPADVDAGLATALLGNILTRFAEVGLALTTDAATLADVADRCNVDHATTDSQVAETFLLEMP